MIKTSNQPPPELIKELFEKTKEEQDLENEVFAQQEAGEKKFWDEVREKGLDPYKDNLEEPKIEDRLRGALLEVDNLRIKLTEKDQLIQTLYAREKQLKQEMHALQNPAPIIPKKKSTKKSEV